MSDTSGEINAAIGHAEPAPGEEVLVFQRPEAQQPEAQLAVDLVGAESKLERIRTLVANRHIYPGDVFDQLREILDS